MRLSRGTLARLPGEARPGTRALDAGVGIAHLGLGAFHRAHQAVFTERAVAAVPGDWALAAASPRRPDLADTLAAQDGLYAVQVRGRNVSTRVYGILRRTLCAPRDIDAWCALVAAPSTRVVTLTVTEAGYPYRRAGGPGLDRADPDVAADLAGRWPPRSALGLLVAALRRRRDHGGAALAVASCDNVSGNGVVLRGLVDDWCAALGDDALRVWVAEQVAFPSSVVDRITPATTDADRARIRDVLGVDDAAPVVTEPYAQWVVEDRFPAGRPAWEHAGAELVADVAPYERAKLRLLNGAHSTLAYLGLLAGRHTVAEAMAEPAFAAVLGRFMAEAAAGLTGQGENADAAGATGPDLAAYAATVLERFANPAIAYRLEQIAGGGRDKLAQRVVPTVRALRARGAEPTWSALTLAAWSAYDGGGLADVAAGLAVDPTVAGLVARWRGELVRYGALAVARAALG